MEHLGQRDADRRVVWIGLHDVSHIRPPFLADLGGTEVLASPLPFQLLIGVEGVGVFVEVDAVVAYTALAQQATQFGEEIGMAALVLLFLSWVEEHFECFTSHKSFFFRVVVSCIYNAKNALILCPASIVTLLL